MFVDPNALSSVAAFHRLFRAPILASPVIPSADRCQLRVSLLEEEVQELADAIKDNDLVEVADALADIQYVLSGAVHEFGMGHIFQTLFDEVQRSIDGIPVGPWVAQWPQWPPSAFAGSVDLETRVVVFE